ncbi:aromatase/cyclase [Actinopolyspora sp. H202]|uniref:aromatase/cyclase n=1 Tax=Actinopolyspora sp. H202 TaxID=1500456 RepID=UPI003EE78908
MTKREVEHEITVDAPAAEVYRLIAEVENWPQIFPPSVHVDYADRGETEERIRIWATANGATKNWISKRVLDPKNMSISFRQETPAHPVAEMGGTWIIEQRSERSSLVRLLHDYRAVDDDQEHLEWIDQAVDRNSHSELASLKENVELATNEDLYMSFEDSMDISGSAKDVYDFLNEARLWEERLPHVATVNMTEDSPGVQSLRMDTRTKDGSTHTTESVRVCFPDHKITYKQTTVPPLMTVHTGCWTVEENENGTTTATSQHTVVINADNIAGILGDDAGVAEARTFIRNALGGNSRATLGYAKEHAEARR